jgi:hypothetical protein
MDSAWIEVVPAYGRDYTNQKGVLDDWMADKDFRETSTGRYVNRSQAREMGLSVIVRYAKLRKVMDVSKK